MGTFVAFGRGVSNPTLQASASACSVLAAPQTCRAASAFIIPMPTPTIRSGQADKAYAVTNPAVMIAASASASFRADRNAARIPITPVSRKHDGAAEIDSQRRGTSERKGQWIGWHRHVELLPSHPHSPQSGHKQNTGKQHTDTASDSI